MNKESDINALILSIERIFGINESDPEEAIRFKELRKVLKYFNIEVCRVG